jgi:uncharacterized heparinase superfamily protein
MSGFARKVARTWAFARHVPVNRLQRRLLLDGKRRLLEKAAALGFGIGFGAAQNWAIAAAPPGPLFAPRKGKYARTPNGWRFSFLNRTHETAEQIDWNTGGLVPENQLWRMNLHYMEYLETAPPADFETLISQWIEANPPFGRGYWRDSWNSYAISLRVVVWMQQVAARWADLTPAFRAMAANALAAQLTFLCANLETDIGGNHLIKNIKALAWASAFFTGPPAKRLHARAVRLLAQELKAQILPDGVHYERSPSYHAQVLADLLEVRHALGRDPLNGALDTAVAAMAQAVADLAHPDGGPAQFNDAGLMMCYSPGACLEVFHRLYAARPQPRAVFAFPEAGYFGFHTEMMTFIADCGPIAPDDLPAHGHGDVLSFECSVSGLRIFVDQGVYQYWAGEKRQASRTALHHNTLCIAGADQADFFGSFRCGRRPKVTLNTFASHEAGFVLDGSHDGFAVLPHGPIHRRILSVQPTHITITDTLSGGGPQAARVQFLLHPDCAVIQNADAVVITRARAQLRLTCTHRVRIEDAVWWPDMGLEQKTHRLVADLAPGTVEIQTQIQVMV